MNMLSEILRDQRFEPFSIDEFVDQNRNYRLKLDPRFPFAIRLYSHSTFRNPMQHTWHERLEINVPLTGSGRFRMGDRILNFSGGDIIIVDNLKLHGLVDFTVRPHKSAVITFMPDLICSPGSYSCDSIYLLPFFTRAADVTRVLRPRDPMWAPVSAALTKVVESYLGAQPPVSQAGCKAYLLEALYGLARHFAIAEPQPGEFTMRMQQSLQIGRLLEYIRENYCEPITVSMAASIAGMKKNRFAKFFKSSTGTTFVTYLTRLRLATAYRLLVETNRSIADIATSQGFADQCYFDRRFRRQYGTTPRSVRSEAQLSKFSGASF